jgi:murein DD-endopeptidase MepM/ murein hydrolase activator NlpD
MDALGEAREHWARGLEPSPRGAAVRAYLAAATPFPVLGRPLAELDHRVMDWSGIDPPRVEVRDDLVFVGRYLEDRTVYTADAYRTASGQWRTLHLGVDLFVPAGHPLYAPLDGVVEALGDNDAPLDYGPVIVLRHDLPDGEPCFTLYGHLARTSLDQLAPGSPVAAGEVFATVGARTENGGWEPHVHVQVLTDLFGLGLDVPGVAPRSERELWAGLCPDPNLLLRVPGGLTAPA